MHPPVSAAVTPSWMDKEMPGSTQPLYVHRPLYAELDESVAINGNVCLCESNEFNGKCEKNDAKNLSFFSLFAVVALSQTKEFKRFKVRKITNIEKVRNNRAKLRHVVSLMVFEPHHDRKL